MPERHCQMALIKLNCTLKLNSPSLVCRGDACISRRDIQLVNFQSLCQTVQSLYKLSTLGINIISYVQ